MKLPRANLSSNMATPAANSGTPDTEAARVHAETPSFPEWSGAVLVGLALMFLAALGWARTDRSFADSGHLNDASIYLTGAESLALGRGYRLACFLDTPQISIYPPLQSLYLAGWWKLGKSWPENSGALAAGMLLLTAAMTVLVFLTLRRETVPSLFAGLVAIQVAVSPIWFTHAVKCVSDPLFATLGAVLAWWLLRVGKPVTRRQLAGAGVILGLMYLTRTAALALIGGLALWCLWKSVHDRDWRWLLALVPPLAAILFWSWLAWGGVNYGHYLQKRLAGEGGLLGYAPTALRQVVEYFAGMQFMEGYATGLYRRLMALPAPWWWVVPAAGLTLLALALRGILSRGRERDRWFAGMCGIYLLQLGVWPFPLGARVVLLLLPWVTVWAWHGLASMAPFATRRGVLGCLAVALAANAAINASIAVNTARAWIRHSHEVEFALLAQWVHDHIPVDEPIAVTRAVPIVHLQHATGRQFLANVSSEPDRRMSPDAASIQQGNRDARWLVTARGDPLLADISGIGQQLHTVFTAGPWQILKVTTRLP